VSLWLDAFTLGAPLSFLDHHLRCGNSLVGSSIAELERVAEGRLHLEKIRGKLRLGIENMLNVSRIVDATASQAAESASIFREVREGLSGARFSLDLLGAEYFGVEGASALVAEGDDIDFSSRERALECITDAKEQRIALQAERVARESHNRFFHWDLEFCEVFFGTREEDLRRIRRAHRLSDETKGFDAVIGNPPYDGLSEHEAGRELAEKAFIKSHPLYSDSLGGRLNVFRPFVLRSFSVLKEGGRHSFIVPMALLADQFTAALRKRILAERWIRSVAAFPQKDDPNNRVFFEAKLSTCIYVAEKKKADVAYGIEIKTYPGKSLNEQPKSCRVTLADLALLDSDGLSLRTVEQSDIDRVRAIYSFKRVTRFAEIAESQPGEIMLNAAFADCVSDDPPGELVLRGGHIGRYVFNRDPKQGEPKYLDKKKYLATHANAEKSQHYLSPRIGYQRGSAVDNWRRIIACHIPPGHFCSDTVSYFAASRYDMDATLALFNSALCEWRFNLTSTNNHVNAYEVDALPVPKFDLLTSAASPRHKVDRHSWERHFANGVPGISDWECEVVARMSDTPADAGSWPDSVHDALAAAGKEMSRIGEERQRLSNDFYTWLVEKLRIDEDRFAGSTHLHGTQATFDGQTWEWFQELLRRNRRNCGVDPLSDPNNLRRRFTEAALVLKDFRRTSLALEEAVDRVVWRLVGVLAE